MKRIGSAGATRRELGAAVRVVAVILVGVVAVLGVWRAQPEAMASLFQSYVTPPEATPTAPASPTTVPTAVPPHATPTPYYTPVPRLESPTATAAPSQTPSRAPGRQPTSPTVPTSGGKAEPTASGGDQRYPTQQARLGYDWRLLFDTLALGASYLWLGCGILLLVGAVLLFAAFWRASRRQQE